MVCVKSVIYIHAYKYHKLKSLMEYAKLADVKVEDANMERQKEFENHITKPSNSTTIQENLGNFCNFSCPSCDYS